MNDMIRTPFEGLSAIVLLGAMLDFVVDSMKYGRAQHYAADIPYCQGSVQ